MGKPSKEARYLPPEWKEKYETSLRDHIRYYKEAAEMLGVLGMLIEVHDSTKRSQEQYPAYVRRFGGGIKDDDEFNEAWADHIRREPHHWQHWLIPGGRGEESTPVFMPDIYAVEMVADWMGSSKAYTGSFDMTEWLTKNLPKIILHPLTEKKVHRVLNSLGYDVGAILEAGRANG